MQLENLTNLAALVFRVTLGIMFLAHSLILKLVAFTLPGAAQFFRSIGIPSWLAYVVFTVEVVAGIFLVLCVQTRWVALATIPILVGATWSHFESGWAFTFKNGDWEYPAYLTVLAVVQCLISDGAFALNRSMPFTKITKFYNKEAMQ